MRRVWGLGIWICVTAPAQHFDPGGKWQVIAQPQGRPEMKMEMTLEETGGSVTTQHGVGQIKNYKQNGAELSFSFRVSLVSIDVRAAGDGNTMTGAFSGGIKGMFTARRGEEPKEGVETGEIAGASYRIDTPATWNGALILYCHGYGPPAKFDKSEKPSPQVEAMLAAGFAVAQSGFSTGGWAVKEAIDETEALRRHWVAKYGKPKRAYVLGHSLGALVALAAIERFGPHYDGALPMCGPLGPSLTLLEQHVFDTLVLFDYYYPGVIGSPVKISDTVLQNIAKALPGDSAKRAVMARHAGVREAELAGVIGFFAHVQKELMERAGGNPFDNRNTNYSGGLDDQVLNRSVERYAADPAAADYLRNYYTPSGQPAKPVLSLHTTYDPLVPAWAANAYGRQLRRQGSDAMYVQRFVARDGHCAFTAAETMGALRDLQAWSETGRRPDAGEQK